MIVCHCNRIDHTDIERAADRLSGADELDVITPVAVYKFLGKVPRCGGCLSLAANIIHTRKVCAHGSSGLCPFSYVPGPTETNTAVRHAPPSEILIAAE